MSEKQNIIRGTGVIPDERSFGVYNMLKEIYPAFAKKIFEGNELMRRLVMSGFNPMDILEYPVCGRCESLAVYSGYAKKDKRYVSTCNCTRTGCGAKTVDPVTFRTWLRYELKKKAPPDVIEGMEVYVDVVVERMLNKYVQDFSSSLGKGGKKKILDAYGKPMENTDFEIRHHGDKEPSKPSGKVENI